MSEVAEKTALEIWESLMIDCGTEEENHQQIDRIAAIIQRAAGQLERENAALREKVEFAAHVIDAVVGQNTALRKSFADAEIVAEYEGEDGRRDWWGRGYWLHMGEVLVCMDRAAFDAARKEAQP